MIKTFIGLSFLVVVSVFSFDYVSYSQVTKTIYSVKNFNDIETLYWKIYKDIDIFRFINPININEEKKIFHFFYIKKQRYNPIWEYEKVDLDVDQTVSDLLKIKKKFIGFNHPLTSSYIELIDNAIDKLKHFSKKEDKAFSSWLTSLYKRPSKELVSYANDMLSNILKSDIKKQLQTIPAFEVKPMLEQELKKRGFSSWKVLIKNIPARMSVSNLTMELKINKNSKFSQLEIDRLIVHEIGTHIQRFENGKKQPYEIFRYGFSNYLQTEEGLAIYSEEKSSLLSSYDRRKYCMRVLAADYACEHDFYDLFVYIHKKLDFDDAFSMATRIKRGLLDSSQLGGYTKDQVYLAGYKRLKTKPKETILKLFIGKIALDDIKTIENLNNLNQQVTYGDCWN